MCVSQQSLECVVLRGEFIAVSFEACTWFPCRGTVRNSSLPTYMIPSRKNRLQKGAWLRSAPCPNDRQDASKILKAFGL